MSQKLEDFRYTITKSPTAEQAISDALDALSDNNPFNAQRILLHYKNQEENQKWVDRVLTYAIHWVNWVKKE